MIKSPSTTSNLKDSCSIHDAMQTFLSNTPSNSSNSNIMAVLDKLGEEGERTNNEGDSGGGGIGGHFLRSDDSIDHPPQVTLIDNSNNNRNKSTPSTSTSPSSSTLSPQQSLLSVMDGTVDQSEVLKEELKKRSTIANQLRMEKNRVYVSRACTEIIEFMEEIDDPFLNDYHNNPYKKASKVTVDKHAKQNVDGVMALRNFNEMVALGMTNCKLELVLRAIKTQSGVNDIDRQWHNNHLIDCSISVLRILAKNLVDQITRQNQLVPPHLHPHPPSTTISTSGQIPLSEFKRNEIINKLSKMKDDTYNMRPLNQQSLLDLRLFWNDPSIQSIYSNPLFKNTLPMNLRHAIDQYSILERVFIGGGNNNNNNNNINNNTNNNNNHLMEIKRFDDTEILDQIINTKNTIPEYYVINDIRITDISSMLTSHPSSLTEKWIKDFSDAKAFIWCCSLSSFNTTSNDFPPYLNPVEISNPSSVLNRKKLLTLKPALSNISLNSDISSPILSPIVSPRKDLISPSVNSPPVNSLTKSIQLFKMLSSQSNVPAIIILTEKEGFVEKIKGGTEFKSIFPDYKGSNKDYHAMIDYIKHQFNPPNAAKSVTFHVSNFDGKEDIKVISNVLFTIQTQDVVDVFIN